MEKAKCDNCGLISNVDDLNEPKDLHERTDPGGIVPAGECPNCGALAYPIEESSQMIWTCVHNHADGIDVGVYESEKAANKAFANMIRRFWWDELVEEAKQREILDPDTDAPFPDDPFEDDVAVVAAYNEVYTSLESDDYAGVSIEPHDVKTFEQVVNG